MYTISYSLWVRFVQSQSSFQKDSQTLRYIKEEHVRMVQIIHKHEPLGQWDRRFKSK